MMTPDEVVAWRVATWPELRMRAAQQRCADACGVHVRTWLKWERGERPIRAKLRDMLRYHLGCRDEITGLMTVRDLRWLVEALDGWSPTPDDYSTLPDVAVRGGIGGPLLRRLRRLSPLGCWAVIDLVESERVSQSEEAHPD